MKSIQLFIMLVLTTLSLSALLPAYAENNTSATSSKVIAPSEKDVNGIQVLEAFDKQKEEKEKQDQDQVSTHKKQVIMFLIGIPLLLLLFTTGALGIAVGVFDKPWFVAHMIFAGLTMTLAIVHLIVGLVWFYPF
ncbi:MAG: hypothetical protein B7Z60_03025 [Ferrovum sp. 37-45-19]|uniref:hypothetical protein n=1 Tax=Ferrovum sp. JA12 TaxID=1356299 RepID=UPI000702AA16|nr:hypothetical protein [Ferrovum sp. JA12]OYV80474.1 MAG: hypothetical protein B7Z65_01095 [Ferrovum sp. 21-44-67]OYV94789.1 MAG: hypothetical protein B7Z60_03025 [Ferrovum sp. 37-45-19]HQT81090.1 hypothetical protein [Ferrovaceae bacterium]KRH79184.1 hypothetical protein FERRO_02470 [Ferrovum sp. JA12]HQU06093.1 hypothetical protein [Ferrovaceae bacterium]